MAQGDKVGNEVPDLVKRLKILYCDQVVGRITLGAIIGAGDCREGRVKLVPARADSRPTVASERS